jgi:hypothetical protein
MKTQSSEKEAEAGQNLKREEAPKHKSTVNGKAVFENGNLVKPKVEQEIADFVEKKKQLEKPSKKKVEELEDEDEQWFQYLTINNVKNQEKREEIKAMISKVIKLPDVKWSKVNDADFVAKTNNRIILKICALSKPATWSVMCPSLGPNICRYEFDEVMNAIPKAHEMVYKQKVPVKKGAKPQNQLSGDEAVQILKTKVEGLSKTSKGFQVPSVVKLTDPKVKAYIKDNGYTATGNIIKLNRF